MLSLTAEQTEIFPLISRTAAVAPMIDKPVKIVNSFLSSGLEPYAAGSAANDPVSF